MSQSPFLRLPRGRSDAARIARRQVARRNMRSWNDQARQALDDIRTGRFDGPTQREFARTYLRELAA